MELTYLQNCPTCGAAVELKEADRIIRCSYCDGSSYMVDTGPLRFVLPDQIPDETDPDSVIYIPYLRFKGHIYSCNNQSLDYDIVDATQLGCSSTKLPMSLGLRPQAMKIGILGGRTRGRFLRMTEKMADIFAKAAQIGSLDSGKAKKLQHRSFIGETISFIYLPTYFNNSTLMDGVLNRPINGSISPDLLQHAQRFKAIWLPRFISTTCPHCADVMQGEKDSLVLSCVNCQSFWHEQHGNFTRINCSVVDGGSGKTYLPFWRMSLQTEGVELESFADFLRLTNQPVVIRPEFEQQQMVFWVPAFKIRPKDFLHIAKNITISQAKIPAGKEVVYRCIFPVTLSSKEAEQALKAVLASAVLNARDFFPRLPGIKMKTELTELVYLPFDALGPDLIQDQTSLAVSRKILYFGRAM